MNRQPTGAFATIGAVLLIAAITGRRWWQMGPYPTGLDGGQWLALGRGLFGPGRSTAGAYPPLVPLLTEALRALTDPSTALKLIAIGTLAAVLTAIYLVARDGLGPWFGLAALATIGPATTLTEPTAFGGYPQQLAFACLLLAAWGTAKVLAAGTIGWYFVTAGGLFGAALSHHIYYPLTLLVCGLVWLIALTTRPAPATLARRTLGLALPVALSLAAVAPTALAFLGGDYAPPLDASGLSPWTAFQYGTREAVWPWLAITIAGLAGLALSARGQHRAATWQVAAALVLGPGLLFGLTGEPRLLPPFLTGAVLGLGFGLRWLHLMLAGNSPSRPSPVSTGQSPVLAPVTDAQDIADPASTVGSERDPERRPHPRRLSMAPLLVAVLIPALLWIPADREATAYFTYYRTLDRSLLNAATAVELTRPEGIVAVRRDWRNWPVGWWFEGLTTARIAVGSDPRWLGFPDELEQAALVDRFFADRLEPDQLRRLAAETGVELLVLRKWEWIGWQRWLEGPHPAVDVLYDDNEFLVLRIIQEPNDPITP